VLRVRGPLAVHPPPQVTNPEWKEQGLHSDVFIAVNVEKNVAVIGGTFYGGEMKKGIFSMMNYWLPLKGACPGPLAPLLGCVAVGCCSQPWLWGAPGVDADGAAWVCVRLCWQAS
jgi:hypothetical protein